MVPPHTHKHTMEERARARGVTKVVAYPPFNNLLHKIPALEAGTQGPIVRPLASVHSSSSDHCLLHSCYFLIALGAQNTNTNTKVLLDLLSVPYGTPNPSASIGFEEVEMKRGWFLKLR